MAVTRTMLVLAAVAAAADVAFAQSPFPDQGPATPEPPSWTTRVAPPRPKPLALKPTGMCTILRDGKVADQKSCQANKSAIEGQTAYLWPSGNRTTIGGTDEDFTVNGNLAAPNARDDLGLCLFVEKTGNTFCYKEGAKPALAAASPAAAPTPSLVPTPVAQTAAAPRVTDSALEEETKLRKSAEEKVKALELELAQLKDAEARRAEQAKSVESEAAKKAQDAEAERKAAELKSAEILAEIDRLQVLCAQRDSKSCQQALNLMNEAVVTGAVDTKRRRELERLDRMASAPFGIPALGLLSGLPLSTWLASAIAAMLGSSLLVTRRRVALTQPPMAEATFATPTLDPDVMLRPPPLPTVASLPSLPSLPMGSTSQTANSDVLYAVVSPATGAPILPAHDDPLSAAIPPPPATDDAAHGAPSTKAAYLFNMILPGSGNAYFGQRAISALLLIANLLAITSPYAADKSMLMGLAISIVSLVMAFFTAGQSLLVGIPIGLLLVLQPASAVVSAAVWLFALGTSQILIPRKPRV